MVLLFKNNAVKEAVTPLPKSLKTDLR